MVVDTFVKVGLIIVIILLVGILGSLTGFFVKPITETTTTTVPQLSDDDLEILYTIPEVWSDMVRFKEIWFKINVPENYGKPITCNLYVDDQIIIEDFGNIWESGNYKMWTASVGGYWGIAKKDSYKLMICCENVCTSKIIFVEREVTKVISLLDASCVRDKGKGNITIILANDGTVDIDDSEIIVIIDDIKKSGSFDFGIIKPHSSSISATYDSTGFELDKEHTVRVIGPSNAVGGSVWC